MKEIFIIWIMWQLVVIGMAMVNMENEIAAKTYVCVSENKQVSKLWGAAIPLVVFIEEPSLLKKYCNK